MDTYEAILERRTIRKFSQKPILEGLIPKLINSARLSPTGMNAQPVRVVIVKNTDVQKRIFPHLSFAGYLPDRSASPSVAEAPTLYALLLIDKSVRENDDISIGAAAMSMILTAQNEGVTSCWMGAINREEIAKICDIDLEKYSFNSLLAFGYPAMESKETSMDDKQGVKYYFNEKNEFLVPKRDVQKMSKII